ncbi:MAG: EAL domain-containing protein [Planctomycetaceae bacterium]|nr:EAL domain-containing protein [Planctomycetaceae bacterium]
MTPTKLPARETNRSWPTEHPIRLSAGLFLLLATFVGAVTYSDYDYGRENLEQTFRQNLAAVANLVVDHVNPDEHAKLGTDPHLLSDSYLAVRKELDQSVGRRDFFVDAFTLSFSGSSPSIVVRSSSKARNQTTAIRTHGQFSPDQEFFRLLVAEDLGNRFLATSEPVVTFPSADASDSRHFLVFSPLRTKSGQLEGVLCLVRTAADYDQLMSLTRTRSLWSLGVGLILVGGISGLICYGLMHRASTLREIRQVMAALVESEQRMKMFIQHAPSAVAMLDNQMRYIAFSRRWLELYGIDKQADITGFLHYEVVPNTPAKLRAVHSRCLTGSREIVEREPTTLPNGKTKWSHWEIHPWFRSDGQIGGLLMSTRDVTHEVEQENLLTSQANRLDLAIHSANLATWDFDVQNEFMNFGGQGLRILGFDQSVKFLSTRRWYDKIHQDDLNLVDQAFHAMLTGKSSELRIEYRIKRIDGTWAWLSSVGKVTEFDAEGVAIRATGISMDISESKESQLALQRATADVWRLATAIDSHSDAVLLTDPVGNILQVNAAFEQMTGFNRSEALGKPLGSLEHSRDHAHTYRDMWDTILSGKPWSGRQCNVRRRSSSETTSEDPALGQTYWTDVSVTPLLGAGGKIEGYVSVQRDVSAEVAREEKLAVAARTDELTGLGNRKFLNSCLARALELQKRHDKYQFAVLFMDVDRFKLINDSLGHHFGDLVLQEVAARLRKVLRSCDAVMINQGGEDATAVRWGGDEFVILLDHLERPEDTVRIAERILNELARPFTADGHSVQCSTSIGIIISSNNYRSADEILRDADIALFEAKSQGKARWVIFDDSMQKAVERRLAIENELRAQREFDQFNVVFQPIVESHTGKLRGTEALVRWKHPRLGFVSPLEFITIAEECHVILDLGQWIMEQACKQWLEWHRRAPDHAPEYVTINISRVQLGDVTFLERVANTLSKTGIAPKHVVFEITESTVMKDPNLMKDVLRRLKSMGIRLAIDDFGTGHSSLSCLHEYPFDILKIDRSFVSSFSKSGQVVAMTQAIVTLARHLGMVCVAEGAEVAAEVQILRECGCELVQGYFFGRPMAAEQIISQEWHAACAAATAAVDAATPTAVLTVPLLDVVPTTTPVCQLS